jgi:hypothetical protein
LHHWTAPVRRTSLIVSVAYRLELQDSRAAAVLVTDELAAEVAAVCRRSW